MNRETGLGHEKVLRWVQDLLLDELDDERRSSITPALIMEKIDIVVGMKPKWGEGLDRESMIDELIRRFSLWIGQDSLLKNDSGHQPWLNASRKAGWRYSRRYEEWLERKLSPTVVEAMGRSTDNVLGLLEDPTREGPWDRRGLVVGHVQSGKTGHYTGLICKAADAGYKVIIVLAGLHNNLRSQTQVRLDEGFLGYETRPGAEDMGIIGVGEIDSDLSIRPNFATNRSEKGDFNASNARLVGITPEQRPWLFVVKKNKTPLDRLCHWIRNRVADTHDPETGQRLVTKLPLLLIDDEADHASVDTGEQLFDADGNPDEEHSPTAINSRIRKILGAFTRSSYVGYTATPFANIFIHERGETREEGPDLFPASFIINLAAPSNYVGPARVFGMRSVDGRTEGLPLVRMIGDHMGEGGQGGWMPPKHKSGHPPLHENRDELPPSLVEAVDAFILACAARSLRGQGRSHASMLVHVTRFNTVQKEVHRQVSEHLRRTRQRILRRIDCDSLLERLEKLWIRDFVPTTESIQAQDPDLAAHEPSEWPEVLRVLPEVIEDIQVRMINGTAKDALDYAESGDIGLKVIAIGGDKLSRGLTLEGLCVSYFLRASRMYDTLMQMGRWFGYRPGYLDLCRLYTTSDLVDWFGHIADASEELREEFDLMVASGADPRAYGLKVKSHPVLMVTSRLKMRAARNLLLSFSGELVETVDFFRDSSKLGQNLLAARHLVESMGTPQENGEIVRAREGGEHKWKGFLWSGVPAPHVLDFLQAFQTHPEAYKVNSGLLVEFIQSMNLDGELTQWTVALLGGGDGASYEFPDGLRIDMAKRKDDKKPAKYAIGRLLSPRDEAIDLDELAWKGAMEETLKAWKPDAGRKGRANPPEPPRMPSGPSIRKVRGFGGNGLQAHPERGLLLLYLLDPAKAEAGFPGGTPPVVGFGISFPGSRAGRKVEYVVNNVLWEQEYGAAE